MRHTANSIQSKKSKNDIYYTPKSIALKMIEICDLKPNDKVLDPCLGGGIFYNNFPDYCDKDWCEIEKDKDFFKYTNKVDCIVGNPPYSLWSKWLEHTIKLTDKFCYIFGTMNLTDVRLKYIFDNGFGITKIVLTKIDWWFGNSFLILFEKGKPSILTVEPRVFCDKCNSSKCKIGRNGNNPNLCTIIT